MDLVDTTHNVLRSALEHTALAGAHPVDAIRRAAGGDEHLTNLALVALASAVDEQACFNGTGTCRELACWLLHNTRTGPDTWLLSGEAQANVFKLLGRAIKTMAVFPLGAQQVRGIPVLVPGVTGARVYYSLLQSDTTVQHTLMGFDAAVVLAADKVDAKAWATSPLCWDDVPTSSVFTLNGALWAARNITIHYKTPRRNVPAHNDCDLFGGACFGGPVLAEDASVLLSTARADVRRIIAALAHDVYRRDVTASQVAAA